MIELLALALRHPGEMAKLVQAGARATQGRAEQTGGGMLARPIVRPGEARVDQSPVDGIGDLLRPDHGPLREHLDGNAAVGHDLDVVGEPLEQLDMRAAAGHGRLHLELERLLGEREPAVRRGRDGHHRGECAQHGQRVTFHGCLPPCLGYRVLLLWRTWPFSTCVDTTPLSVSRPG